MIGEPDHFTACSLQLASEEIAMNNLGKADGDSSGPAGDFENGFSFRFVCESTKSARRPNQAL
jgi:hypothetical protein